MAKYRACKDIRNKKSHSTKGTAQDRHRVNETATASTTDRPNIYNQPINIFLLTPIKELVIYNQSHFPAFSSIKKLPLKSRKNFPTKKMGKNLGTEKFFRTSKNFRDQKIAPKADFWQ